MINNNKNRDFCRYNFKLEVLAYYITISIYYTLFILHCKLPHLFCNMSTLLNNKIESEKATQRSEHNVCYIDFIGID